MGRKNWPPLRLWISFVLFLVTVFVGAVVFNAVEDFGYGTAVYFVVFSLTTVGYGDVVVKTPAGYAIFVIYATIGIPITFYFISTLVEWVLGTATLIAKLKRSREDTKAQRANLGCARLFNRHVTSIIAFSGFWLVVLISATIFYFTEDDIGFGTAFYWSFATAATIGFGDIAPKKSGTRAWACIYAILAVMFYTFIITKISRNFAARIHRRVLDSQNEVELEQETSAEVANVLKLLDGLSEQDLERVRKYLDD